MLKLRQNIRDQQYRWYKIVVPSSSDIHRWDMLSALSCQHWGIYDLKIMGDTVNIRTPKTFAVITLKFEQDGFTVE